MGLQVKPQRTGSPNQSQVVFQIVRTAFSQDQDGPAKVVTTDNNPFTQITVNKQTK